MMLAFQQIRYLAAEVGNQCQTKRYCFWLRCVAVMVCFHALSRKPDNRPPPYTEGDHYGLRLNLNIRGPNPIGFSNTTFPRQEDVSNDAI